MYFSVQGRQFNFQLTWKMKTNLNCTNLLILCDVSACDEWKRMPESGLLKSAGRYGHTAVQVNR